MTIGILTLCFVGVFIVVDGSTPRPRPRCEFFKDSKGYLAADCTHKDLKKVPEIKETDVETFDLRNNHIGKLANDSFSIYPKVKRLMLAFNRVHTVEPEALEALDGLELLDLTQNAVKEVPAGLPKSLRWLYLGGNPVSDFRNLAGAVGLHALVLRGCELTAYPDLGVLPNLVELDVAENGDMAALDPVRLAATCRLAKLNVTDDGQLFEPQRPGAHCRCRRVVEWTAANRVQVVGLNGCPDPLPGEAGAGGDDDPDGENCARAPEAARAAFKACMAEWEHRNTPYWAIGSGLAVAAVLFVLLCVCLRRRRRRRRDDGCKGGASAAAAASSDKENGGGRAKDGGRDVKEQLNDADAAAAKTEPAALLS